MTEFKPGDIVRITKGETDEPGYKCEVRTVAEGFPVHPGVNQYGLLTFENAGWTVELVERPAPPLPTKPNTLGWATLVGTRYLARLADGQLEAYNKDATLVLKPRPSAIEGFEEAVLIPKDLADKVTEWADDDHRRGWHTDSILEQIADHLKGQDDE